jgi:hypothetical protein
MKPSALRIERMLRERLSAHPRIKRPLGWFLAHTEGPIRLIPLDGQLLLAQAPFGAPCQLLIVRYNF